MKQTTQCFIDDGQRYLMLHRTKKQNDENHDKWIAVGGKFEEGESPEECMLREVWEETGYTVTKWQYRGIVTFVSDIWPSEQMHLFVCTEWTGQELACDEGDLAWVDKAKLDELPMWEGDKLFISLLAKDIPFFSLKLKYKGETLCEAKLNGESLNLSN